MKNLVAAIALVMACSGKAKPAEAPPPSSTPAIATDPAPEKCGADGPCAAGLECVKYFGVAGKAGGEMASCEHRCKQDTDCSEGKKCKVIADGPGQVCR